MRPRASILVLCAALVLLLVGCMGTPTPLAPGLSGSVGLPHAGVLTGATALPERGTGYRLLRNTSARYGTPRLVETVKRAAREVAGFRPGAPLLVGDLSNRQGGFRNGHRSHRTGRDVDLLLYCTTPDGRSIPSPGFVRFGADGLAETEDKRLPFVRFDTERNWQLVKALVSSPEADVEWLFLARWLEALLIEHARARGEDPELVWRAENVLLQPKDSAPHDDHIHLRVACTPAEAVAGCEGRGPAWPWLPAPLALEPWSDTEALAALLDDLLPGKPEAATGTR
ncbi:penicillin-insensitive murein endopeptidase [Polyangium mundeleinium]|uniref:Penicillin-insensitive murein endopeptidase n=1 Tax=Polyangium mundeleinium TaxID=2995306 RepID=A0ABT5F1Z3_9BACT|nr:penicillin-insensitive murein endopeptidase [Polyangium mundeleinium]MDC0748116.1 penicillin-insensitive murein endopeptidase [Polyangium mundeleinium]